MSKVNITFEISKDYLFNSIKDSFKCFYLKLKKDINLEELEETLSSDISNYFDWSLTEFLEEGLNNDLYTEYFN